MSAEEEGVDVLDAESGFHGDECFESGDVEAAGLTQDAAGGEAGDFPGGVDHGVEGVGDDDDDGIGSVLFDVLGDVLDDFDVGFDEVVAGHAGFAG